MPAPIEVGTILVWALGRDKLVPVELAEGQHDANASEIVEDTDRYFADYWAQRSDELGCTFDVEPSTLDSLGNLWSRAVVASVAE